MIYSLRVPGPIDQVDELRVLQWHGAPGRSFAAGELMVEMETHKAVVEVRARQPGVLRSILIAEGDWEAVGRPIALLSDGADEPLPHDTGSLPAMTADFDFC